MHSCDSINRYIAFYSHSSCCRYDLVMSVTTLTELLWQKTKESANDGRLSQQSDSGKGPCNFILTMHIKPVSNQIIDEVSLRSYYLGKTWYVRYCKIEVRGRPQSTLRKANDGCLVEPHVFNLMKSSNIYDLISDCEHRSSRCPSCLRLYMTCLHYISSLWPCQNPLLPSSNAAQRSAITANYMNRLHSTQQNLWQRTRMEWRMNSWRLCRLS